MADALPRVVVSTAASAKLKERLLALGLEVVEAADSAVAQKLLREGGVALCDPALFDARIEKWPLDLLIHERIALLLRKLGLERVPNLYRLVLSEVERGVLAAALGQTRGHLGQAAQVLGIDRNTVARRAQALGLKVGPRPGRKRRARARF